MIFKTSHINEIIKQQLKGRHMRHMSPIHLNINAHMSPVHVNINKLPTTETCLEKVNVLHNIDQSS